MISRMFLVSSFEYLRESGRLHSMDEIIIARKIDDPDTRIPMRRDDFYKEQIEKYKKTGEADKSVDVVDIFLLNEDNEILVQKRSRDKKHNPRLLDKSLGGHVQYPDTVDYTVMVETVQELQVPSIVLKDKKDFKKTLGLLRRYLDTVAIIRHIDSKVFSIPKMFGKEEIAVTNYVHLFFGTYFGRTKPTDKEATGILHYAQEDLEEEMRENSKLFTQDLHVLLKEYGGELKEFKNELETKD